VSASAGPCWGGWGSAKLCPPTRHEAVNDAPPASTLAAELHPQGSTRFTPGHDMSPVSHHHARPKRRPLCLAVHLIGYGLSAEPALLCTAAIVTRGAAHTDSTVLALHTLALATAAANINNARQHRHRRRSRPATARLPLREAMPSLCTRRTPRTIELD
jgi:hypothetical protein